MVEHAIFLPFVVEKSLDDLSVHLIAMIWDNNFSYDYHLILTQSFQEKRSEGTDALDPSGRFVN